ncbi:MAG: T9SS type A sorting domain-containing protein [Cyclobacteriaceae bacterium]|nr:T9SS type A sorting domain-containing protein [Cyclobacteriaceae bacterium]
MRNMSSKVAATTTGILNAGGKIATAILIALLFTIQAFAQPTNQAKDISVLPIGAAPNDLRISWTNGNGSNRIVIITSFNGSYTPVDGAAAPASNANYGAGTDLDPGGAGAVAKCVFNSATDGGGTFVNVSGLSEDTRYYVYVYEYSGSGASTLFNKLPESNNPIGFQSNRTNGSFTQPSGVTKVSVQAWGGGGGGGGADNNGTENRAGGGGAGGSYTASTNVTISGNVAVTIGAGGSGGAGGNSAASGGTGGTTTFGALVSAAGGAGGTLGNSTDRTGAGAGVTTGTTANGGAGGEAPPAGTTTSQATGSGAGGASGGPGGAGGNASTTTAGAASGSGIGSGSGADGRSGVAGGTAANGFNAAQLGGGGSGGWDNLDDANASGGDGFRGQLIVTWTTPPTPTISILGGSPTNGKPLFRVLFSTPINTGSFTSGDVTITGTATGTLTSTITEIAPNNGTAFSIEVSGMTASGTVIANIAAGVLTDVSGNANLISNANTTINYTHDVTGPTVAITVSGPNPTNVNPVFQVVFNEPITISSFVGTDVTLTGTAGATTATINEIAPNDGTTFTVTASGMTGPGTVIANIAAGVIQDRAATPNNNSAANLNTTINFDNQAPTAPGTPTAAAGPIINDAEEAAGFNVVVPLGTSGAVANDKVELLLGGAPFGVPIIQTLNGTDITNTFATINVPTGRLGADGAKSITARVIDEANNTGPAGGSLALTLDTTFPTAPGNPTAAAGPRISATENGAFSIVVPGINTTGAVVNDVVKLYVGGVFLTSHTLTGPEAAAASYTFTNVTLPAPDGAKNITATITDEGGNEGPANAVALALTLDTAAPTAPSAPTAAAGPTIDGAEYTAGFTVNVAGLGATGAVANDVLELLLGGAPFPTPLTNTLDAGEIAGGNINFTINCNQLGADGVGKLITARVVDEAGNVGAASPNLSLDLSTEPTAASTLMNFTGVTTTQATINFTSGAGTGTSRIIVARQGGAVSFVPSDNTTYSANNDFAAATDLGGGNKVVGTASGNTITNLPSGDVIHFAVFEYNNCAGRENYFGTSLTGSQAIGAGTASTIGTGSGAATISSLIDTQAEAAAASANFSFVVDDDGATDAADAAPTRITSLTIRRDLGNDQTVDWTNVIGGIILTDGTASINTVANPANFTLAANSITITGIPSSLSTDLGYVGDNTTKTLQVKIWLSTSITGIDIDNKRFVFTANVTDFTVAGVNSSGFAASTATSGAGNGQVNVVADRLAFTNIPGAGTAGTDFSLNIAATDVNGYVDLNQTQQVTITAPSVPATGQIIFTYATPSSAAQNMTAGRAAWTGVKVTAGGNYTFRVADTDGTPPALTQFTSGFINFLAPSNTSFIAADGAFIPPVTIDYTLYQHASLFTLAAPPPAGSIEVGRFIIADGFGAVDPDDIGTTLTALTFSVNNPGNLRFVGISDGTNIVATAAGAGTINLSGMNLLAEDTGNGGTGTKTFSVFASFDANVVDNEIFDMTITSVSTGNGGSTFAAADGGGASTDPTSNMVVVTADRLAFVQQPTNVLLQVAIAPAVTIQATDALGSRDLDVAGTVGMTSTGSLSSAPTALLSAGFGTYSGITFGSTATGRTVTTTNLLGLTNATSSTFNITASATADIIANTSFIYPQNILYANFQEPANLTAFNSPAVGLFDIRDGGAAVLDADNAPTTLTGITFSMTNPGFIRRAALYVGAVELAETTPAGSNLVFTGFNYSAPDNGTATFVLRVSFTTAVVDNQQVSFTVTSASTQPLTSSTFALGDAGGAVTSTALDHNRIEVMATQLVFTTDLNGTLLPQVNISTQQAVPVVTAVDGFSVRDRDYGSNITISCALSLFPSITLVADAAVPNAGLYTFPSNFQYLQTGNGTLSLNAPGVAGVVSNVVNVQAGTATTITAGAVAPATISSLVNTSGAAVAAFNFIVNDDPGGTPVNNDDGLPTLLSQIVITANGANNTIPDWSQALAGAILTDGTNNLNATAISANSITFGGINTASGQLGFVADNASKTYTLRIYLRSSLLGALPTTIDGLKFEFQVLQSNIFLATNSTGFNGAQSSTTGNRNVVAVVASTLRFLYPTVPTTASLDTDFPGISVEAVDANNNRDLGFTGAGATVRELSNTTSATMANGPVVGTTQFSSGLLNFASNFRYTTGTSGDDVTLTIKAGAGGTTCGVNAICATSPTLTLLSSFESSIVGDPTFNFPATIPYVLHQEPTNIQNTTTSLEIGRMLFIDGSRSNFPYGPFLISTGTDNDGLLNSDQDGAATNLTSLTIRVNNPSNIRRLALYNGSTEIGTEINVAAIGAINGSTAFYDFTFTGAPLLSVADNSITTISIRASFRNTSPEVTDGDALNFSIVAATVTSGSNFFPNPPPGAYIAGVSGGYQSPGGFNIVNVQATKLDFVVQPPALAGIANPVTSGSVEAHDQFGLLDTGFSGISASVGAAANVNGTFTFNAGVLDLTSMTYGAAGNGTLTVTAAGLSSNVNNTVDGLPNVAVQCNPINVLHVTAFYTNGGPGGVVTSTNLIGGTANRVIFGFTFKAEHTFSGEPEVTRFTLSFSNSTLGVFNNMRVVESTSPVYAAGLPEVTTLGATYSQPFPNLLQVDFTSSPRDLVANPELSYFLIVDVDANASGNVSNMQVGLLDDNVVGSQTNNFIVVSNGSSQANVVSQTYTFASIFPPTLVSSYPNLAQTNVDPAQPTLSLQFSVPVWTLDGKVRLTEKASGTFVDLTNINGACCLAANLASPIIFNIPPGFMQPNKEYFVTIAPGVNTQTVKTGIMDEANNLFPGISFSGTLYFRTFDPTPPKLLGVATTPSMTNNPGVSDITATGAVINAGFDRPGKAYFMVTTESPSTVPTNAQINGAVAYPNVVSRGTIDINSVWPITQYGIITPAGGSFSIANHYVWIYAETYSELNGVKTAFPNTAPYGGAPNFTIGGTGPTLLPFTPPGLGTGPITLNLPNIAVCNNSFQVLNSPIIISEGANTQFNTGGASQTLSMVLPTGFQFDVTESSPGVPRFGTVQLQGTDFIASSGAIRFLGNSIVQIRYANLTGNGGIPGGSRDKIIISGLRVLATSTSSGSMFRLGGTALTSAIPDATAIATLRSYDAQPITFDNSYSTSIWGISQPGNVVTAIPDNADDNITLTPYIDPTLNDYGPSTFSGQGVSINVLTLAAVTPDVPFNITITHKDNNGCISSNPVQYLVYDHKEAVNIVGGNGPFCITNTNFVVNQSIPPTYGLDVKSVPFNNLASHYMEQLTTAIPAGSTDPINATSFGGAWVPIIASLPNLDSTELIGGRTYRSFSLDMAKILDARALSSNALPEPYNYFRDTTSVQQNTFYTGGRLGVIELTGTYRNSSNPTVQVPRRQLVEVWLPPIPIVEVGQGNQPNPGTPVYCEAGGPILITGWPSVTANVSSGRFTVVDAVSSDTIYVDLPGTANDVKPAGFTDFGNGSAQLDPFLIKNLYRPMRIIYTFKEDLSPCEGSGSIVIQVTPNPVANFEMIAFIGPNTPTNTSYCEGRRIRLDAVNGTNKSTIPAPFSIVSHGWYFGESGIGAIEASGDTTSNIYDLPSTYNVELEAKSNTGCLSVPTIGAATPGRTIKPLTVGGIPVVNYKLEGVSTADSFLFNSNSDSRPIAAAPGPQTGDNPAKNTTVSSNDNIAQYQWDFGDGTPFATISALANNAAYNAYVQSHTYTTPGRKLINLIVTSQIGCRNSLALQNSYRSIVVLPRTVLTAGAAYFSDFEPVTTPVPLPGNRDWQVWGTGTTIAEIAAGAAAATWEYGPADGTEAIPDSAIIHKANIWKTNIKNVPALNTTNTYSPGENSALYSPSFNLTALTRPMISFNAIVQMEESDGVVLEYSKDNLNIADPNKVWKTLGQIGTGESWYTDQGIAGRPGTQTSNDFGWSGSDIKSWQSPKHVLDSVFRAPAPTKVVFRWAIGSAAPAVDVQGFTLDNVRIGDRTRTILLESFASTSNPNPAEKTQNDFVKTFIGGVGTEVIKLNYHLNFPGRDPFNEDNPADPSSRALFYNITATPRSVLDGEKDAQDRMVSQWGQDLYNLRTLQLAQANIKILPTLTPDGAISIDVEVTSKLLTGLPSNTLLHVLVLEKEVPLSGLPASKQALVDSDETSFEYVVKKMLPNASGTPFGSTLAENAMRSFGPFIYRPEAGKLYPNADDLVFVAFLQETTPPYEVYQVNDTSGIADPPVVTGLEPLASEQVLAYPNPAHHELTVQLPGAVTKPAVLNLVDQTGRIALRSSIPEGSDRQTLNVSDLSGGIYILTVDMGQGVLTRKKVMIVHQD